MRAPAPMRTSPRRSSGSRAPTAASERRRRERHYRRRRRDLLEDTGLALLLTIVLISLTAGLGILALIEVPIAAGLVTSLLAERSIRKRRTRARRVAGRRRP